MFSAGIESSGFQRARRALIGVALIATCLVTRRVIASEVQADVVLPMSVASPFSVKEPETRSPDPLDARVTRLDFNLDTYRTLSATKKPVIHDFPVAMDADVTLELEQFSITSDQTLFVRGTANGDVRVAAPEVTLFRGKVAGHPDSLVYLGMAPTGCNGIVFYDGREYILAAGSPRITQGEPQHVIYDRFEVRIEDAEPWRCFAEDLEQYHESSLEDVVSPRGVVCGLKQIDVAVESDYEYRTIFSTAAEAEAYLLELFGAVTTFYERDVQATLFLTFVRVWDTNTDPYPGGSTVSQRLTQFRSYWRTNMGSVSRDTAHMLSGESGGGIAYVATLCSTSWGYGVSGSLNGTFPNPIVDPHGGNWDLVVVAHEIGHNCNTPHTHCYNPPIDKCYNSESGCWSGSRICTQGTLMSYCHLCFGGVSNIDLRFHQTVIDRIQPYIHGRSCVGCADLVVSEEVPERGSTIGSLPDVSVTFNQSALGVAPGDLSVNGSAATTVTGSGVGPYLFSGFASPGVGTVNVVLDAGSIVSEETGDPFAGDSWTYDFVEDCNGNAILDTLEDPVILWRNTSAEVGVLDTTAPVAQDIHLGGTGDAFVTSFQVVYRSTGTSPGTMMVRFYAGHLLDEVLPSTGGLIAEYDAGQLQRTTGDFAIKTVNVDPFVSISHNLWMEVEIDQDAGVVLRADPPTTGGSHGLVYDSDAQDFLPGPVYMNMKIDGILCTSDCNGNSVPDDQETDTDGDDLIDACDLCPGDSNKIDPGQCGCGQPETDTDGDGSPDCVDECPNDPNVIVIQEESAAMGFCEDGIDNDCDGLTDGEDPGCLACSCGDIDKSGGAVDLADFVAFASCFGLSSPAGGCTQETLDCSDLNGDNVVDLSDFVLFAGLFGAVSTDYPPNCG